MRKLLILLGFVGAQPLAAATTQFDVEMSFEDEFFQDAFIFATGETISSLSDGQPYGFEGRFSSSASGDPYSASVTYEADFGLLTLSECSFAGQSCLGGMVSSSSNSEKISVFDAGGSWLIDFDLANNEVLYFEDAGTSNIKGLYRGYGANFGIVSPQQTIASMPVPASVAFLLTGFGLLGLWGRRKKA